MNLKNLCLNLVNAESEKEVINILTEKKLWNSPANWTFFGGRENNYGDIGNQQSKADGALVEKIINSVDAILMAENNIRKHENSNYIEPKSIREATEKFFKVEEGKLSNITPRERTKLAEKISLIATGTKSNPNYTILDFGEGQTPKNFKNTFLSLGESNKIRTHIVQGVFNMGGTGVLRFCGKENLQLIISRRHPKIAQYEKDDETKNFWGFTIVRRENPTKEIRSSTYKYLIIEGDVPFFHSDTLPLGPKKYPEKYGGEISYGTFIKLYEYDIGAFKTLITLNLNYRLSLLIPQIAIPIRLFETRKYEANTLETTMSGLEVRIEEDKSNNLEEKYISSGKITVQGESLNYSIYPFKKDKKKTYSTKEGIIFLVNGQTQGSISNNFFKRKSVGLGYIADSLLVIADCSNFTQRTREDFFKNDRETIISGKFKSDIEKSLEDELRNNKGLRLLNLERKKQEIENKLENSKPLAEVLGKILKKSPTLSTLLLKGMRIKNPFNIREANDSDIFKGKFFPTYFKLIKSYTFDHPKEAHLGSNVRVKYKTDAQNDYFERKKDPGSFELYINGEKSKNSSIHCWNGTGFLSIKLPNFKLGEIVEVKSIVKDISNEANPFEEKFFIKIIKENNTKGSVGKRKPPSKNGKGTNNSIDGYALPEVYHVRKKDWDKHGFNEKSCLKIITNGNSYDFFMNMDNIFLINELKSIHRDEIKLTEARYEYGLILIALALLNDNSENENIDEEVSKISEKISPIIIPMITSLGDLKLDDIEANDEL